MLIAYILFCFIALFMTYRRHRREKRIRQLEDHWERYYEYQYTQEEANGNTYHQGNRNPRLRQTVQICQSHCVTLSHCVTHTDKGIAHPLKKFMGID